MTLCTHTIRKGRPITLCSESSSNLVRNIIEENKSIALSLFWYIYSDYELSLTNRVGLSSCTAMCTLTASNFLSTQDHEMHNV